MNQTIFIECEMLSVHEDYYKNEFRVKQDLRGIRCCVKEGRLS